MQEIAVQSKPSTQLTYGLVEVQNLSVCFGDKRQNTTTILDKINFTVEPGAFVCLLGPSGCWQVYGTEYYCRFYQSYSRANLGR